MSNIIKNINNNDLTAVLKDIQNNTVSDLSLSAFNVLQYAMAHKTNQNIYETVRDHFIDLFDVAPLNLEEVFFTIKHIWNNSIGIDPNKRSDFLERCIWSGHVQAIYCAAVVAFFFDDTKFEYAQSSLPIPEQERVVDTIMIFLCTETYRWGQLKFKPKTFKSLYKYTPYLDQVDLLGGASDKKLIALHTTFQRNKLLAKGTSLGLPPQQLNSISDVTSYINFWGYFAFKDEQHILNMISGAPDCVLDHLYNLPDVKNQLDNPYFISLAVNLHKPLQFIGKLFSYQNTSSKDQAALIFENPGYSLQNKGAKKNKELISFITDLINTSMYDINTQNPDGETLLFKAAREKNCGVLNALLDMGANPKIANCEGMIPEQMAPECFSARQNRIISNSLGDLKSDNTDKNPTKRRM